MQEMLQNIYARCSILPNKHTCAVILKKIQGNGTFRFDIKLNFHQ